MLDELYKLSRFFLKTYNKSYKRYILSRDLFSNRLSILIGPRGVGKTTAIIQYILSQTDNDILSSKVLYIPVDHFVVANQKIYEIAENFYNLGGELIVFDEIHKYTNWSIEIKSIYDTFPKLKIIASGSSVIELIKGTHDLSRRSIPYSLAGLSFREYLDLILEIKINPITLDDLLVNHESLALKYIEQCENKNKKIFEMFHQYLKFGYFPYFLDFDSIEHYYITLEQGIHTTIESDLLSVFPTLNGSSIKKLKKLLSIIASSVPFTPDLKTLKNLIEVGDERTLKTYLIYLEKANVIRSLYKHGKGLRVMEKPEKIYLDNPNQIYAIGQGKENIGSIRETFFLNMLSLDHEITSSKQADFCVDNKYVFEIGGKNKTYKQIQGVPDSYIVTDDIEIGINKKIPLWLFGFLY